MTSYLQLMNLANMLSHVLLTSRRKSRFVSSETELERLDRLNKAQPLINKSNGLKEFIYSGTSIWALNKKNADKKARKLKLIL